MRVLQKQFNTLYNIYILYKLFKKFLNLIYIINNCYYIHIHKINYYIVSINFFFYFLIILFLYLSTFLFF